MRHYRFVRFPSRLRLTIGQISGLRSFMALRHDKREYRRAIVVFQKADGKTYDYIAREHRVHVNSRKSGKNRLARMMDSPYHPYSDTRFTINEKGADDMEEDALSKRSLGKKASKASIATNDS